MEKKRPGEGTRTNIFYFEECSNIKIADVFIKDATSWVTHYERCRNVVIDNIRLESMAYWNNDRLDIVDCRNLRIINSDINCADNAICLKSLSLSDFCDSISIENCRLRSSANAVKLGTGSKGGFKNIKVKNIKIYDTYRSAIDLEAVDGGFLQNIDIQNITAKNTGSAIFTRLGHRNNDGGYSAINNIVIKDVTVEVPAGKPDAGYEMEGPLLRYPVGIKPNKSALVSVSPWNNSLKDRRYAVALLNRSNTEAKMVLDLSKLSLTGKTKVRDVWSYKNQGVFAGSYSPKNSGSRCAAISYTKAVMCMFLNVRQINTPQKIIAVCRLQ